jgi:hypothetical protein
MNGRSVPATFHPRWSFTHSGSTRIVSTVTFDIFDMGAVSDGMSIFLNVMRKSFRMSLRSAPD